MVSVGIAFGGKDQKAIKAAVEPFGVGEVFLIAGQSYAGGYNDENLKVAEPGRRVAAFNWRDDQWQVCDDPVPHVGPKGTIWPALGDLLVPLLQTPVGFVNAAVGGTSTRQWAVDGPLFKDMVTAGKKTGKFRAVLWQQGESDVIEKTPTDVYVERMIAIRTEAMKQWGREVPWLPAKSTLHPTVYRVPENGRRRFATASRNCGRRPASGPVRIPTSSTAKTAAARRRCGTSRASVNAVRPEGCGCVAVGGVASVEEP